MAYERTNWQNGDVISSEKLNKMEAGIEYACSLEHEVEDPTEGQVLKYDAEKEKFVNGDVAIETNIQNPTDGQTLKYDAASGKWVNAEGGGSTTPLVIHVAGNPLTMDKTAGEIKAAFPNVVLETLVEVSPGITSRIQNPLQQIEIEVGGQHLNIMAGDEIYAAESDDGYPEHITM